MSEMDSHRTDALRPETLAEFDGQPEVVNRLSIVLNAAKRRNQRPSHICLSGPPGLGKTSLANIIAKELGLPITTTSGPAIEKVSDLSSLLLGISRPTVLFIDEIHRLPRAVEEYLYAPMEDGMLEITIGEGASARAHRLPLESFVLIGATTQTGLLSRPFLDRFGFSAHLKLYNDEALAGIVERSAGLLKVQLTKDGALELARRSRGTPRVANKWLRLVRDWSQVNDRDVVDAEVVAAALGDFGVDALGLDEMGRDILVALVDQFNGGPVGLNTLAAAVGEAPVTLDEVYEPYMMSRGLLQRTPRGRVATEKAYVHLGKPVPASVVLASGGEQLELDT